MNDTSIPSAVRCALDRAERMNRRLQIVSGVLIVALLGAAVYWGAADKATQMPELLARAMLVIAIMIVLVTIRLRYFMEQNTQIILRAIYAQRKTEQ